MALQFLTTLGEVRLDGPAGPLLTGRRKELTLLAYLARRAPRSASRDELCALFWGDRDQPRARHSLRQSLLALRRTVADALDAGPEAIRVDPGILECDVARFEADVADGRLADAVARWGGEYLAGCDHVAGGSFGAWLEGEREALRQRLATAFGGLVSGARARGDWREAAAWADRWTLVLPFDETAATQLVDALRMCGRWSEAAAAHAAFRERLRRELEMEPSPDFLRLARAPDSNGNATADEPVWPASAALLTADLVGRGPALSTLLGAVADARHGERVVVLVEGPEGIGRTRLCEELTRQVGEQPSPVLSIRCRARELAAEPLALLRHAVGELLPAPGLSGASDASLAQLAVLVPALRERYPRLPAARADTQRLAPAFTEVLEAVAAEVPVVLLVDDACAADVASQRLLLDLGRTPPAGVAVILTVRAEELPGCPLQALHRDVLGLRRLLLQPLTPAETETVLGSMLALPPGERRALAARLHAESGGNPLVLTELVAALADDGLLRLGSAGHWEIAHGLPGRRMPLPASVRDGVRQRLQHLGAPARRVVEAAAAAGPVVDAGALAAASGLSAGELVSALDELVSRRLLRHDSGPPERYRFPHELLRRVVLEATAGEGLHATSPAPAAVLSPPPSAAATSAAVPRRPIRAWARGLSRPARYSVRLATALAAIAVLVAAGGMVNARLAAGPEAAAGLSASAEAARHYFEAERLLADGRDDEALRALERAVAIDSTFALAHYRISVVADALQRQAVADAAIEAASRHRHTLSPLQQRLVSAGVLWRRGNAVGAGRLARAVLDDHPDEPDALAQLAEVLFHTNPMHGRGVGEAMPLFEKQLELDPTNTLALAHLIRAAAAAGRLGDLTPRLAALSPTSGPDWLRLELAAWQAVAAGDTAELWRIAEEAGRRRSTTPVWHLINFDRGGVDPVRLLARWQAARGQVQPGPLLLSAGVAAGQGRWRDAQRKLNALTTRAADYGLTYRAYFQLLPFLPATDGEHAATRQALLGLPVAASNRADLILAGADEPFVRQYLLGRLAALDGDTAAAAEHIRELSRAHSLATRTRDARFIGDLRLGLLAELALLAGDTATALGRLETMSLETGREDSSHSVFHGRTWERYLRADLLARSGRPHEALRWLAPLGELSPLEFVFIAPSHLLQARIHDELGQRADALHHYTRFIELWSECDEELRPWVLEAEARVAALR